MRQSNSILRFAGGVTAKCTSKTFTRRATIYLDLYLQHRVWSSRPFVAPFLEISNAVGEPTEVLYILRSTMYIMEGCGEATGGGPGRGRVLHPIDRGKRHRYSILYRAGTDNARQQCKTKKSTQQYDAVPLLPPWWRWVEWKEVSRSVARTTPTRWYAGAYYARVAGVFERAMHSVVFE